VKVGLSTSVLEPIYNNGHLDGVGVYTKHLYEGFRRRNVDLEPLAFNKFLKDNSSRFQFSRSFPYSFPSATALSIATGGRFRMKGDADIYHITDYKIIPIDKPVVATLYDAIPLINPKYARASFRGLKNYILKRVSGFADHVIAISNYSVAELNEVYRVTSDRISIVHCGVDQCWLEPVPDQEIQAALKARELSPGYFLFVGTLQPRKNVSLILDAYEKLPEHIKKERSLVVIGRAGWGCEEDVKKLQALELAGNVRWLKDVYSFDELRLLYHGAGIFVFPSLYEGFGLPIVEAFACNIPVITSNSSSLPEVANGAALEIDPTSVKSMQDAMVWLAEDAVKRSELKARGIVRATELTWEKTVEATLAVYRKLV